MSYEQGFIDGAEDAQFGVELTVDDLLDDGYGELYGISYILGYADGVVHELEAA